MKSPFNIDIFSIKLIGILLLATACTTQLENPKPDELKLWYTKEAKSWMREALPIGNGYMGAMVFGGIDSERIQFNEESLWSGGPGEWEAYNGGNRAGAHEYLPSVRELLSAGKYEEAHQLARKELTGVIKSNTEHGLWEGYGAYQAFGDLYVEVENVGAITEYKRELNISRALAEVRYKSGDTNHKRRYFANYPNRVMVFKFENDANGGLDYDIELQTPHTNVLYHQHADELLLEGKLQNNGMAFGARVLVTSNDGQISITENKINVESAKSVTLKLTVETDYTTDYPNYKGNDFESHLAQRAAILKTKSFDNLLAEHIADYQTLFNRVSLELGSTEANTLPTDERLLKYGKGFADPSLESLYFQYGRYLLISSSRPGTLPANLQGKWNDKMAPPWASDYHMNINEQMIYWPAESTNLSECHKPLLDYMETLVEPGKRSARDFFNADGWIVNTMNNTFGFTAPGWDFPWGFFPGGAAWLSQHAWEHYAYTQDEVYLEEQAFPLMKEAAQFWLDYLVESEDGFLVSAPSYSPEHGGISSGASMDMQIVWDLFTNCIAACELLEEESEFKKQLESAKNKLLPPQIGSWGQLQEWKEDRDDPKNKHRHISHLFALHPGNQINLEDTPDLAQAAKVSLNARGDEGTGWSLGWKINFWARLQDGNRSHKMISRLLRTTTDEGFDMIQGGGTYNNLLCAHPPFQLDGNMGATAGIAEMLLQSQGGRIRLLPALPDAWKSGSVTGLKARGNFEIDMKWHNGRLQWSRIKSILGNNCTLEYNDIKRNITLGENQTLLLGPDLLPLD